MAERCFGGPAVVCLGSGLLARSMACLASGLNRSRWLTKTFPLALRKTYARTACLPSLSNGASVGGEHVIRRRVILIESGVGSFGILLLRLFERGPVLAPGGAVALDEPQVRMRCPGIGRAQAVAELHGVGDHDDLGRAADLPDL